ncbi:MAG: sugar fermentation stimulation protein [Pseudobutyrivibrio ruminis]|nr:sugar fermentation stimulation protein [Pseudobutyrivibrio ruminis]
MKKLQSLLLVLLLIFFCFFFASSQPEISEDIEEISSIQEDDTFDPLTWKNNHTKVRGIYVTGPTAGTQRMDEIINLVNETELNTIVLDVKDDNGNISFEMNNAYALEIGACIPYIKDINALLKQLKDNNIYVIARVPCFKDPILASAKPELGLCTYAGEPVTDLYGNAWVNPCRQEVWDYIISICESCAELGFDEIQLDYVRFPVGTNAEQANYGTVIDDTNRQEYINTFINQICASMHEMGVPVTADVFGTIIHSQIDAEHVGQDYQTFASTLDVLCPMIYPSHYASGEFGLEIPDAAPYETIYEALSYSKNILSSLDSDEVAVIRPWLQAFDATWVDGYIEYDGTAIRKEIQAVYDAGYEEWILWNSKSIYSSDGLVKVNDKKF